jgi:hypothetical protein
MDQAGLVMWVTTGYIVLSAVVLLAIAVILYRLVRAFWRILFGREPVFGADARTRVIAFGVSAILFPTVLPWAVYMSVWGFVAVFSDLPRWWLTNWQRAVQLCETTQSTGPVPTSHCLGQAAFGFLQALGSGLSDAYKNVGVNEVPFRDAVFLVTLWAILAQFFSTVDEGGEGGRSRFRLQAAYSRLTDASRRNFHFFMLLSVAGYLSVAAIAAIPSLQESGTPSESLSPQKLQAEIADNPQSIDVNSLKAADPFTSIDEYLRQPQVPVAPPTPIAPVVMTTEPVRSTTDMGPSNKSDGNTDMAPITSPRQNAAPPISPSPTNQTRLAAAMLLSSLKVDRQDLLRAAESLNRNNLEQTEKARASALTIYKINVGRKGSHERSEHFEQVVAWYQENITALNTVVSDCERSISRADSAWKGWAESFRKTLDQPPDARPVTPSDVADRLARAYPDVVGSCRAVPINRVVPSRAALGSNLGPFGLVASWLVRTESLPLALIVGLMGFGLLGSACSSFVRHQATNPAGSVLIADMPSVLIRGVSAAVVVFLAVEGGLAIFSTSAADPNPYVLLLTCLVAAVFSEDVWEWAHKRLRESFSGSDKKRDGRDGSSKAGGTPTANAKATETAIVKTPGTITDANAVSGQSTGDHERPAAAPDVDARKTSAETAVTKPAPGRVERPTGGEPPPAQD